LAAKAADRVVIVIIRRAKTAKYSILVTVYKSRQHHFTRASSSPS
jgi:hypothetical protein